MPTDTRFDPASLARYAADAPAAKEASVPPPPKGLSKYALWMMLLGQGADVATTAAMVPSDRFRESNRMGLPTTMAAKAGLMTLAALLGRHSKTKVAGDAMATGLGIAGAAYGAKNLHTYATAPKERK